MNHAKTPDPKSTFSPLFWRFTENASKPTCGLFPWQVSASFLSCLPCCSSCLYPLSSPKAPDSTAPPLNIVFASVSERIFPSQLHMLHFASCATCETCQQIWILAVNWKDVMRADSFQHLKKLKRHYMTTYMYVILR